MREILFRGKRIDNGEWVYGYYVYTKDSKGKYQHFIVTPEWFIVNPETVEEYTGLNDKNRKKIFEGDIIQEKLEDAPELLYMVIFKEGSFLAKCVSIDNEDIYLDDFLLYGEFEGIVIGNIHDIPELMEGKP